MAMRMAISISRNHKGYHPINSPQSFFSLKTSRRPFSDLEHMKLAYQTPSGRGPVQLD